MSIVSEKILSKIRKLKDNFEVNSNINHQGVKGKLNEIELTLLIKDVIPKKYQLTNGIVENSIGEQSHEADLLIFEDEILPSYIEDNLSFTPIESIKYYFEIKSKLTSKELNTTIQKFEKFRNIGGSSPTVLFGFSSDLNIKSNELLRYKKNDDNFLFKPKITVFTILNKCYYFFETETVYLKDILNVYEFIDNQNLDLKNWLSVINKILANDSELNKLSTSSINLLIKSSISIENSLSQIESHLVVNGIKFSDISFKIHRWIGIESNNDAIELSLLSGISNTLSKEIFGKYLLANNECNFKIFSVCYEDMWGNISFSKFDKNGFDESKLKIQYHFSSSEIQSKLLFSSKEYK